MKVVNVVLKGSYSTNIDLEHLASVRQCIKYDRKIFSGARWRELGLCMLLFSSGKFTLCGAKTPSEGNAIVLKYAEILCSEGYDAQLTTLSIQTMTGSHDFERRLHLEKLCKFFAPYADLTHEVFPALIYRQDKRCAVIFHTGKVNILGGKSEDELFDVLNEILFAVTLTDQY